ncbi:MAG: membrane protein insertase YidC [Candidatus Omnitrophica bacterium]|nr:membrane protein insertase YidC [Candidatus Omnitrophota bacterium]MCM8798328.1 membrane protein insertase YidC [Candidatus Omnitrophota bacterium]
MEKKSFLGFLLILLLLLLYPYYLSLFSPPQQKKITKMREFTPTETPSSQYIEIKELKNYDTVHDTVIRNNLLEIKTSNQGGGINLIRLIRFNATLYNSDNYDKNIFFFSEPLLNYDLNKAHYTYTEQEKRIEYHLSLPGEFALEKIFALQEDSYLLSFTLRIKNLSPQPLPVNLSLLAGENFLPQEPWEERYWEIVYPQAEKIRHEFFRQIRHSQIYLAPLPWFALKNKYFVQILVPSAENVSFALQRGAPRSLRIISQFPVTILPPEGSREENFLIYFGPLDSEVLKRYNKTWAEVVYYGMFDGIAKFILKLLKLGFAFFKNYGLAIIFLSFLVNLFLFPFTWKSTKAMRALQNIQPQIEQLRKTYGQDVQRLNREILELYRKHKVNPLGGCLPLFLQMPIFISLYQVLVRAIELKGAKFLWIKDLALPDALITFPRNFFFINSLNLLPLIMAGMVFLQQKKTQVYSSSQRQTAWFMPLFLGFIFYNFPAGVVLYWLISTGLNLCFSWRLQG